MAQRVEWDYPISPIFIEDVATITFCLFILFRSEKGISFNKSRWLDPQAAGKPNERRHE
jgi:hypothetical protein